MKKIRLVSIFIFILFINFSYFTTELHSKLKIASLHPLLTDLAENIGGKNVVIINIMGKGINPHTFSPNPSDLIKFKGTKIILASGKNFEPYLRKINIKPGQKIFEVGKPLPSCKVEVGKLFICCPTHSKGAIDPHWWHSISNMDRAARYLMKEFSNLDPENASRYNANTQKYRNKLKNLKSWAKREISKIPRNDRKLVTTHAAFGYFCREFGFKSIPVQGLTKEKEPTAKYLAKTINIIKKENIKAVFPENNANPKILRQIAKETGAKIAQTLIADGVTHNSHGVTYEYMIKHNIKIIVSALK